MVAEKSADFCFHCQEPIPKGLRLFSTIDNTPQAMCCTGCQAVADTIMENGLGDYYRYRTEPALTAQALVPKELSQKLAQKKLLDDASLQDEFTSTNGDHKETILTVDGISCAACAWLIEKQLIKLNGVIAINVNASSQRASVRWHAPTLQLSDILLAIDAIGYQALPFKANTAEKNNLKQRKSFIKRLGVSGILMMQIMMIATGLYFGAFADMSAHNLLYLRWISFILSLPIIFYGATPFYRSAYSALRAKRLSMDVPVSIAILLAFLASAWATIFQQGEVYFESVSMFTFLLLLGKFLEFNARSKAAQVSANLLKLMPLTAIKIVNNIEHFIVARKLQAKDIILVKPGEVIAADGHIIEGCSQVNEAMLSGEQVPVEKDVGAPVFAGTINGDGNVMVEVKHNNQQSFLKQLILLSEKAQAHKPKLAKFSDKIAQYFVAIILISALFTAVYWYWHLPQQAFWITLSVLVATCPCALSLATPTALTCATTGLNKQGIMIKSAHVLETMPTVDYFAFDKTGTLTTGNFSVNKVLIVDKSYQQQQTLSVIAALEIYSEHPIARAFIPYRDHTVHASNVNVIAGKGIVGDIANQKVCVGKPQWLFADKQLSATEYKLYQQAQCVLTIDNKMVAAIYLEDKVRSDAIVVINQLHQYNRKTVMLSGDNEKGCQTVQQQLNIQQVHSALSAQNKLAKIQDLQQQHTVAMVGDGINDTPVFSAAHLSIAMGGGTEIAKSGADVILLTNKLTSIINLQIVALKTQAIIRQNYSWAFGYNLIALPLAVTGHVTPYMAVIGMSLSSLLVISNSLRLLTLSMHR
jgi:Cu2+-exporting ATPase